MTDNTDGFDTGIGIEEETGPESGMPSEGPDMTRDRPALFDGDTGDMPLEARMAAIALKRERYIDGSLYDRACQYREAVERSLNNDMLRLVDNTKYRIMYASPVTDCGDRTSCSLKTRVSLTREEAATLAALRHQGAGVREPEDEAGRLAHQLRRHPRAARHGSGLPHGQQRRGGHGEEDHVRHLAHAHLRVSRGNGDENMYVLTPLVPMVLDQKLADRWLGSDDTDGDGMKDADGDGYDDSSIGADGGDTSDSTGTVSSGVEQDAFDFDSADDAFDGGEH